MYTIVIPRENHHTRLYTSYRASQIYFNYLNKGEECELIDLNCEKQRYSPINKTLIIPIEWNFTFINPNFQLYINQLSNYNNIIITGRYVDYYGDYTKERYYNCNVITEKDIIDWNNMLIDPIFLINKHEYAYAPIESSIGCSGICSFCSNRILSTCNPYLSKWKPYAIKDIVDFIEFTCKKYGVFNFCFNDNNFINSEEHALNVSNEVIRRNIKIKYAIETRVDNISDEIVKTLKKSGMRKIMLGLESGSNAFLKRYNKGTTVQQNKNAIHILKQNNINIDPQIILFYPQANYDEIGETLEFINEEKLYNFIANGGSFITKMMTFNTNNPEDMYLYEYRDERVQKFEEELQIRNITKIQNEQSYKYVKSIYDMFY